MTSERIEITDDEAEARRRNKEDVLNEAQALVGKRVKVQYVTYAARQLKNKALGHETTAYLYTSIGKLALREDETMRDLVEEHGPTDWICVDIDDNWVTYLDALTTFEPSPS